MEMLQLTVTGMTCGGCETAVRNALGRVEGVDTVTADHVTNLVGVSYDADKITPAIIREKIEALGYQVAP